MRGDQRGRCSPVVLAGRLAAGTAVADSQMRVVDDRGGVARDWLHRHRWGTGSCGLYVLIAVQIEVVGHVGQCVAQRRRRHMAAEQLELEQV